MEEALELQGWPTRGELEKALGDYPPEAEQATPPQQKAEGLDPVSVCDANA